jgi:hypothetical protein
MNSGHESARFLFLTFSAIQCIVQVLFSSLYTEEFMPAEADGQEKQPVVKACDIVWLEGWGGIIGVVNHYDEETRTLHLTFPNLLFWPSTYQPFHPVKPEDIKVLSPAEVMLKMSGLMTAWKEKIQDKLTERTRAVLNSTLMGNR